MVIQKKNNSNKNLLLNEDLVVLILSKVEECHCLEHYRCLNCQQRKENLETITSYTLIPNWLKEMIFFCIERNISFKVLPNKLLIGKNLDYCIYHNLVSEKDVYYISLTKKMFLSLKKTKSKITFQKHLKKMKKDGIL